MRIVSELIKPSVTDLILYSGCPIEYMDVIAACVSVTQIQMSADFPAFEFQPDAIRQKLQAIAPRNRELARFVANPREYPGDELLTLMLQCDSSPTGRYMLARCLPEIDSFFKTSQSTDSEPK